MSATILTANDQPLAVDASTAQLLAFGNDGNLWVSEGHLAHPFVMSFRARLEHMGTLYEIQRVPLSAISSIYSSNGDGAVTEQFNDSELNKLRSTAMSIFNNAALSGATDISILVRSVTEIKYKKMSYGEAVTESAEWGNTICRGIFQGMTQAGSGNSKFTPLGTCKAMVDKQYLPKNVFSIRISSMAVNGGYEMALRMHYKDATQGKNFSNLAVWEDQRKALIRISNYKSGLVLLVGPTGSGKSTMAVMSLNAVMANNPGIKVVTVEDPVEIEIPNSVQTVVMGDTQDERERNYADSLSNILRHDPDVIFISELRDAVAMRNVMAHAAAGHLVKSTLHTQNPLMIIARLVAAGVSPKVLLTPNVLRAGIGCMLMPVLCKHCKIEHHQLSPQRMLASKDLYATYGDKLRFKGAGCAECDHKGVTGVRPCLQIVEFDVDIIDCLIKEDYSTALALWLGFGDDHQGSRGISMRNVACMGMLDGDFDALDAYNKVDGFDDSKDFPNTLRVLRAKNAASLSSDTLADAATLDLQERFKQRPLADLDGAT